VHPGSKQNKGISQICDELSMFPRFPLLSKLKKTEELAALISDSDKEEIEKLGMSMCAY
jgi:hypothetical protein